MSESVLLHVEDDDAAAYLFRLALEEANISTAVFRVSDGRAALDFLQHSRMYAGAPRPKLIVLDLNLPRVNGWQVLTELRATESLSSIPVIILTTSSAPTDQQRAMALGVQDYIVKPHDFEDFISRVTSSCSKLL